MKTIKWQSFFKEQKEVHDKKLFTINELVNVSSTNAEALNVELYRLKQRNIIDRYARGVYGLKNDVEPERLVRYIDEKAYITGFFVLDRHGMISQVPSKITCFTNRRHNRSRERMTPIGRYEFVCVSESIYSPPKEGIMTEPEQALFDFVYLMRHKGVNSQSIVTFQNLHMLREHVLLEVVHRYPKTVRAQVTKILNKNAYRANNQGAGAGL